MAKQDTLVWNGEQPWLGIGTPINNDMSLKEVMQVADLDWEVVREPSYYRVGNQEFRAPKDILRRSDDASHILTDVPEDWHITQNEEAFGFFWNWIEQGKMRLVSAGSMDYSRIVWVLAEVGSGFELFKGDVHQNNILFTLPHRYGRSIDVRQTPVRIACNNMMAFALKKGSNSIKWDHRKPFDPEHVRVTLSIADKQFFQLKEYGEFLGRRSYEYDKVEEYVKTLYPVIVKPGTVKNHKEISARAQTVLQYLDEQPGAEHAYGTWWQVFQSVTFCINHVFGRDQETRLSSAWYGKDGDQAIRGLKLALEYADK